MGLFRGSKDEHHESPCDKTGTWWAKPNPIGWGSNEPHVVKHAGRSVFEETRERGPKAPGSIFRVLE